MGYNQLPLEERFWMRTDQSAGPDACWSFSGTPDRDGYPVIKSKGKQLRANRVSWMIANGEIPEDKPFILHSCDNRGCVNPKHLRPGTNDENMQEMVERGRSWKLKKACKRGHLRTPKTYRPFPGRPNSPVCRPCMDINAAKRKARKAQPDRKRAA